MSPSRDFDPDREFRVVTFNIHAGRDAGGAAVFDRQVDFIRGLSPDLLAVQETDRGWPRSANQDHHRELAAALGMRSFFSPNLQGPWAVGLVPYQYGLALLWRAEREKAVGLGLPGVPGREHRGLAYVELEIGRRPLVFATTHLGRSAAERLAQARFVSEWLASFDCPAVVAGDFNMTPDSLEYQLMASVAVDVTHGLDLVTYPQDVPDRQRDYVFTTGDLDVITAATADLDLSDHRPVIVDFRRFD